MNFSAILKNTFFIFVHYIAKQDALNKSSFFTEDTKVKHTFTLQLFTKIFKKNIFTRVIKMPSWKVWVQIPSGLLKSVRSINAFRRNYLD